MDLINALVLEGINLVFNAIKSVSKDFTRFKKLYMDVLLFKDFLYPVSSTSDISESLRARISRVPRRRPRKVSFMKRINS